jgi:hypothetical protein
MGNLRSGLPIAKGAKQLVAALRRAHGATGGTHNFMRPQQTFGHAVYVPG